MAIRNIDPKKLETFTSIGDFVQSKAVDGQVQIIHRGVPVDLLIENKGYPTTVFYFHPALVKTVHTIPLFTPRSISTNVNANAVFIADPTLALDERLNLAWYAGNRLQFDLQAALCRIIDSVSRKLQSTNHVFFGASGGGFASLYHATALPGSVAVVMNPQTNIRKYLARQVYKYAELAWGRSEKLYDPLATIPVTVDLTEIYSRPVANSVIYLQNAQDSTHVERQWRPFRNAVHPSNHIIEWADSWGDGHVAAPKEILTKAIQYGTQLRRNSETSIVEAKQVFK